MIEWQIPTEKSDGTFSHQKIEINSTDRVFLLGANGTGKSSLLQYFLMNLNSNYDVTNLTGNRTVHFSDDKMSILPDQKNEAMKNIFRYRINPDARWTEPNRLQFDNNSILISELIEKIQMRNSKITNYFDSDKLEGENIINIKEIDILKNLNNILCSGSLGISISLSEGGVLQAKKRDSELYSIKQLSDGERNAILVALSVLLARDGSIILLDEPDLHFHPSMVRPFLESLFECRPNCPFIIATHEIVLPTSDSVSKIVLVRSCKWNNRSTICWDIDVIERNSEEDAFNKIPDELKVAILGSRKKILFVEGDTNSLDKKLYSVLFQDISIFPVASCRDVISSVDSLNDAYFHHNVQAYGIIDRDSRSKKNVDDLRKRKIFAIDCHSVESLYYDRISIEAVARNQVEIGRLMDATATTENAISSVFSLLINDKNRVEKLALKKYEHELRNLIISKIPKKDDINLLDEEIIVSIKNKYNDEKERIYKILYEKNWNDLLNRYSLRDVNAFLTIVDILKCKNRQDFERILITKISNNDELANALRQKLGGVAEAIESKD